MSTIRRSRRKILLDRHVLATALTWCRLMLKHQGARAQSLLSRQRLNEAALCDVIAYHKLSTLTLLADDFSFAAAGYETLHRDVGDHLQSLQTAAERLVAAECELSEAFASKQIDWIALKGLSYGRRYWGDIRHRHMGDLDILLQRRDLKRGLRCLAALGFRRPENQPDAPSARTMRQTHATEVRRDGVTVDIHWRLRSIPQYDLDDESVWLHRQELRAESHAVQVLSIEDDLLFLLLSIVHDVDRGAVRIKHLLDAYVMLSVAHERIDWDEFRTRSARQAALPAVVNGLALVLQLLAADDPLPHVRRLTQQERPLVLTTDDSEAFELLAGRRGNPHNQRWFKRMYPRWTTRSVLHALDRNVRRPGRIPWIIIKQLKQFAS